MSLYDAVLLKKKGESYSLASPSKVQGAAMVMDVASGEVLAVSGGFSAGPFGIFAQNNRATRSLLQPGSTVKPFTYLYALNKGVQPNTQLGNYQISFPRIPGCGFSWTPANYSGGGGSLPMSRALESSVNRSFLNLFVKLTGIDHNRRGSINLLGASEGDKEKLQSTFSDVYQFAAQLGAFPELQNLGRRPKPCLPWLIGGYETTLMNMTQAYASLANGGLSRKASFLNEVLKGGRPLLVNRAREHKRQVEQYRYALENDLVRSPEAFGVLSGLKPQAVAQLRSLMSGIVSRGTARRIKKWEGLVAGKTGTTNNSKDVWFAGFNSRVAVVVWVGYDNTKDYASLGSSSTGASLALPLFEKIMTSYYELYPEALNEPLPNPLRTPGLVEQFVQPRSGKLVRDFRGRSCKRSSASAIPMYFLEEDVVSRRSLNCGPLEN